MPAESSKIKAVVFDADGTLYEVRAEKAYEKLFSYLSGIAGSDPKTVEAIWRGHITNILNSKDARSAEKRRREYSIEIVLGQLGIIDKKAVADATEKALEIFWKQALSDLKYRKSDVSAIAGLKEKFALAVASDEYRKNLEMKLGLVFGSWKKYFRFIIAADDTGELKPSEKYAVLAVKKLGIAPEEAMFVGDSWARDLAPAKLYGMKTLLVGPLKEGAPDFWEKDIAGAAKLLSAMH